MMFSMTRIKKLNPLGPQKQRKLLFFRGCVGTCALLTFYFAFKLLDPSDCIAIVHSSVIITSILARIFLKEKLTIAHIVALLLTAVGIFLISKPKSLFNEILHLNHASCNSSELNNANCTHAYHSFNNTEKTSHQNGHIDTSIYLTLGILLSLCSALANGTVQVKRFKVNLNKQIFNSCFYI